MDDEPFQPRLGRMRSLGSRRGRKYLHVVIAAAARAGLSKRRPGRPFGGSRIGRGGVSARALSGLGPRARRAIVKTKLVRLGGRGMAAARAHLSYIQRDGVAREGEAGRLYSAGEEDADGRSFLARCEGDRHQFRFIASAEDGSEYDDLRPLIRRFMARMEVDLGTPLDWVAADHADTLHPHTHIILRGKDDRGQNLVIAPDYIRHGMRERLAGIVSLDLGPRTDFEIGRALRLEVEAERLTSIDRRLLRGIGPDRTVAAPGRSMMDQAIRAGRLRKLAGLGLAEDLGDGRWRLGQDVESVLRRLGERGDIIRTMQRALTAAGLERSGAEQLIYSPDSSGVVTGRLVARGLSDEQKDRHYVLIDGSDGRGHYVDVGSGSWLEPMPEQAIIRVSPRTRSSRESDLRIASVAAANGGRYNVELHSSDGASARFAEAHVRRLEAIRRSVGGVERLGDGSWSIPGNFVELAGRHEELRRRARPVDVELLSAVPLERLPAHDGATWLDRELAGPQALPRENGFGRELRSALEQRRSWLIGQGLASIEGNGIVFRPDMVATLERRELARVAGALSAETGLEFVAAEPGSRIEGVVRRRLDLASGRFAMIGDGHSFSLVPWRPILERALGRQVAGTVSAGGGISWALGRERGIGL